jgi:hypothetical protein
MGDILYHSKFYGKREMSRTSIGVEGAGTCEEIGKSIRYGTFAGSFSGMGSLSGTGPDFPTATETRVEASLLEVSQLF